jgi:hypothetical protein
MAKTEMAKSYEGVITVRQTTIERLQTIAEFVQQLNCEAIKRTVAEEFQAELSAVSGKHKFARQTITKIESTRDKRIALRCEAMVETKWAVDFSDESTISDMTANEVMNLSNLDSRQLTGIRITSTGASSSGGLWFRFDAKKHDGLSRISILVTGQENDVRIVFGGLQEIAKSSLELASIRGSFFRLHVCSGLFLSLLGIALYIFWIKSGHKISDSIDALAPILISISLFWGGTFVNALLSHLYPSWNCTIGDGDRRFSQKTTTRQNWLQYGFGGVVLAGIVGFAVNMLASN